MKSPIYVCYIFFYIFLLIIYIYILYIFLNIFFHFLFAHQANLQPNLLLLGSRLRFNPTPTFLGFTFDRTLSFSRHVSSLKAKFFPRLKALRCISASSWGPSKESLSVLYKSFLRFLLTYASPRWFPFLSATNLTKLERLHRATSHAITGCLSSFPYPSSFLRGFFTSPTSHLDSFHPFLL